MLRCTCRKGRSGRPPPHPDRNGTARYMKASGLERKSDVAAHVARVSRAVSVSV